jgi:ribosome modulation factor
MSKTSQRDASWNRRLKKANARAYSHGKSDGIHGRPLGFNNFWEGEYLHRSYEAGFHDGITDRSNPMEALRKIALGGAE